MILDLPPDTAQMIAIKAKEQNMTDEEWALQGLIANSQPKEKEKVLDFIKDKRLNSFGDPVAYQQAVSDE